MPSIEINGKKFEAEAGAMIIEVADGCNVQIPRFCYHKKLSIAANCRMCLVEVERAPKPLPACATPVTDGMKVWTHSPKALQAQKAVMEFLLINHPLDCPICDQGGECELQDVSMGYGQEGSRYIEAKRVIQDKDIGPLISTDMTRCIQCTRCVRFGSEIAGLRELGAIGRGEHLEIGTYIKQSVHSELSGNVIDLCPVGALTSKPFRFKARGWELKQTAGIAPHDGVGSHIFIHTRRNQVMRVVPKENETVNEVWISDKDRFSYEALYHPDRLQYPKIKLENNWKTVSWEAALQYTANTLITCVQELGSENIGALIAPNATVEEGYLFQKWLRYAGITNIDHRLRQSDFREQHHAPLYPGLDIPIAEIEQQSVVLLVGSHIHKEQPILGHKVRKMTLSGGKVLVLNPIDFSFNFEVSAKTIVPQGDLVLGLARVAKAILGKKAPAFLTQVVVNENDAELAKIFMQGEKKLILIGALATTHPAYTQLIDIITLIVEVTHAKIGLLMEGANHAGMWLTGCVPHRLPYGRAAPVLGLNARKMWENKLKAYILFNLEPEADCLNGIQAMQALQQAKPVIAITPFESEALREVATVLLPLAPFAETAGTLINIEGLWQSFKAATSPLGESRPGWKILSDLGHLWQAEDFQYQSTEEICKEVKEFESSRLLGSVIRAYHGSREIETLSNKEQIVRIAPFPLYATDNVVRRAASLQKTKDAGNAFVHFNNALANRFQLGLSSSNRVRVKSQEVTVDLPFIIDDKVPDNTIMIYTGILGAAILGAPYSVVEMERI